MWLFGGRHVNKFLIFFIYLFFFFFFEGAKTINLFQDNWGLNNVSMKWYILYILIRGYYSMIFEDKGNRF
jgi:hypothetical protein